MPTKMTGDFPLAKAISQRISGSVGQLVADGDGPFIHETTSVTSQLLRYWFQDDYCSLRETNFHSGQRDAILAVIYAHEVLGLESLLDAYQQLAPDALLLGDVFSEVGDSQNRHPKYAAKMATGTGKTWVLNALLIWQYLNSISAPDDRRFSRNFLVVAPGLIVYERLLDSFQGKNVNGERIFETSDLFATRDLFVPDNFREQVFGFLKSSVVTKAEIGHKVTGSGSVSITNWHLLAGQEDPEFLFGDDPVVALGDDIDPKLVASQALPLSPGNATGNSLEVLDRRYRRGEAMEYLVDLPDLVVFNDEAHHIHTVKKGSEVTEVEWQKSLRQISASKGSRFIQVDFSATPFNEVGAASSRARRYFPHIVVDFDITDAMQQGLVKTLALDRRKDVASLPLEFSVDRDEQGNIALSEGQRVMLRAGFAKLQILENQFAELSPDKHPKMMVICEDTSVVPLVEEFLLSEGLDADDVLSVHSGKKSELGQKDWDAAKTRLFGIDRSRSPSVIVSVLMLREGFDVNNICVIVPLRAAKAAILLEQTIGRGLRLMWRGDSQLDDEKRENRERVSRGLEPSSYLDMLFIVEHPAFQSFYDDLMEEGLVTEVAEEIPSVLGQLEKVDLRENFAEFDFEIPIVIRDAEEEMRTPTIDPLSLSPSTIPLEALKSAIGSGDQFTSQELRSGTQFGDYRVDGGVMTATGYNDYISRLARRISDAHGRAFVTTNQQYKRIAAYPLSQIYRPLLIGWLDSYIRNRLFGQDFNPFQDENWRVLMVPEVATSIAGEFGTLLVELQENLPSGGVEVSHRLASEIGPVLVRKGSAVPVNKSIYPLLPFPARSGGLEKDFLRWADRDSKIEALIKIHEYKHDFLRRPYLKVDGTPAQYAPDFLVRTSDRVYLVETKGDSSLSDENVTRKKKSAVSWCARLNELPDELRSGRTWHYVLAGESVMRSHLDKGATCSSYLDVVRLFEAQVGENSKLF